MLPSRVAGRRPMPLMFSQLPPRPTTPQSSSVEDSQPERVSPLRPVEAAAPAPTPAVEPESRQSSRLSSAKARVTRNTSPSSTSAWGKFVSKHETRSSNLLQSLDEATRIAQVQVERVLFEQVMTERRRKAQLMWKKVQAHVHELGKTNWMRIIDREMLYRLRAERDRQAAERAAAEAAALAAASAAEAEARRLAEEARRRQEQEDEWRRRVEAERLRLLEAARLRALQNVTPPSPEVVPHVPKLPKKQVPILDSTKRSMTVVDSSEALNKLQELKQIGTPDLGTWILTMPEFLPWRSMPPTMRGGTPAIERRQELASTIRNEHVPQAAAIAGSFVDQFAVKAEAPTFTSLKVSSQNVVHPVAYAHPTHEADKRWNASRTPSEQRCNVLRSIPTTQSWSSLRRAQAGLAPASFAHASARDLGRDLPPVKGSVPFQVPGLLTPVQRPVHMDPVQSTAREANSHCIRSLVQTMSGAGKPHLLPIGNIGELLEVLEVAGIDTNAWPDGTLKALYSELAALEGILTTCRQPHVLGRQICVSRQDVERDVGEDLPPCPFVLLKRTLLCIQVLSDDGKHELMERRSDHGHVSHCRICAQITDRSAPESLAAAVVAQALGVEDDAVLLLDSHPLLSHSVAEPSGYPSLRCEYASLLLKVSIDGLPSQSFRSQRADWVWRSLARAEDARRLSPSAPSETKALRSLTPGRPIPPVTTPRGMLRRPDSASSLFSSASVGLIAVE